ncbi:MAG: tRNA uridine-5-carboxymethylaminomethyl(34) synthesis GTPase MnmE [Proteobacteria bacterium]|jgi:tRNA modification GTPase TrmE|nr:MAG: tRNA uridine-5-carboxymethylaminomethyl(34) synthesis GTPase MnmE [Pseudomonadota bacterium]
MSQVATIFALSSAPGRAGVAVLRISGPAAGTVLDEMAAPRPRPRQASLRRLRHPVSEESLDQALVLWFPAPASFTGEDVAELHVHGGRAVVHAVLGALAEIPGCRPAEAGEFARRAFENGKLDLTMAEGLADLIDAETEAQRKQALRQAEGALAALYDGWRNSLIEALALVEAAIDFSDEGDVGETTFAKAVPVVQGLEAEIRRHLADGNRGEILREGFHVVLAGPPNVGKSSLLNALARRDAAIVSDEAGTTRDVIEVRLDLEGLPIIVSDTAGIREAAGRVEQEGIRRTLARSRAADLIIWLMDATAPNPHLPPELAELADRTLWVTNKIDLREGGWPDVLPDDMLAISARTGQGIDELARRIAAIARERLAPSEHPSLTQERHRRNLSECQKALIDFLEGSPWQLELRAEDLRIAARALGRITGRIDPEQVLDEIFGRFCIGK